MGTFMGHVLPGSFFLVMGVMCAYQVLQHYYLVRRGSLLRQGNKQQLIYRSSLINRSECCRNLPVEEIIMISMCLIGLIGEVATGIKPGGKFLIGNGQHITMYSMFGTTGLFSLLKHYRYPIIPGVEYLMLSMALALEGLLFYNHLHDRKHMDIQVHIFLVYLCALGALSVLLEYQYRNNILPALCRCFFFIMQGAWFIQVAFILYPPFGNGWDLDSHEQMMLVAIIYAWHFLGVTALLSFIAGLALRRVRLLPEDVVYEKSQNCGCKIDLCGTENNCKANGGSNHEKYMIIASDEEEL